jgi:hypothetical protein
MNFKRFLLPAVLIIAFALPTRPSPQTGTAGQKTVPPAAVEKKSAPPIFSYNPENRRDPFKDLFGGVELREKKPATGLADMEIAEVVLMGIVKFGGRYEAIVAFPDGFPLNLKEGQKLADGFVLAIEADRVIFRKTSDKGFPLSRPKDIIKEISPEERTHD